jgi:hypothetical protein
MLTQTKKGGSRSVMNRVYENHRSDARQLPLKTADPLLKFPSGTTAKHSDITAATPN